MKREPRSASSPHELLVHLAAGELKGIARWRLLQQIARNPELAREWAETQMLWSTLRQLQTCDARPAWPERAGSARDTDRPTQRRIALSPAFAVVACGITVLGIVGGTFAARSYYSPANYDPYRHITDRSNHVWHATLHFRGEVKIYDRYQILIGSFGNDWDGAQNVSEVTADVQVDGLEKTFKGFGLQPYTTEFGETLGYVAIVPETEYERSQLWAEHEKKLGHSAQLSISNGVSDGWGRTSGYFGGGSNRMDWKFIGVGEVRFRLGRLRPGGPQPGKILRRGIARPVTDTERAQLKNELGTRVFVTDVAPVNAIGPDLTFTYHGRTEHVRGYKTIGKTLPDGTEVTVEVLKSRDAR